MTVAFRLGLVLPQSASRATTWLNGWRLAAPPRAVEVALGYSAPNQPAAALARSLLSDYRAHALAGLFEAADMAALAGDLAEWRVPLLGTHAGSQRSGGALPWVARLSGQAWHGQWALGAWAGQHLGRTAALTLSPDTPADEALALVRGFEAHGGHILTTHRWHGPATLAALRAEHAEQPFEVILAVTPAHTLQALETLGCALAHAQPLAHTTRYPFAATWSAGWLLGENAAFVRAYQRRYGASPDIWAVLGYEAGQRVAHSLAWGARAGEGLLTAWQNAHPAGPRALTWHAAGGGWLAPTYLSAPGHAPQPWPVNDAHPALALWHSAV